MKIKKNKIKDKKLSYEELNQKAQENLAGWKRAKADYENLKKRTEEDKKKIFEYANSEIILDLLPVIDNFDSAYSNIPAEIEDNGWVKGIGFIKDQFNKFLQDNGIEKIKTQKQKFNPELHEAIEMVDSDLKAGMIVDETLAGYKLKNKVIRPSKVKVAK
jgi:molecular chaperone GrpE